MGSNETPLAWQAGVTHLTVFLGSADRGPFLRPGLTTRRESRAAAVKDGRRPPLACAARSVLDGGEHGAGLDQDGTSGGLTMHDTTLLQLALALTPPWTVSGSDFDPDAHRLDIEIDFPPGSRFACPSCGAADCPAHDTERKTWRHLNFFQHQAYLNARVPRVRCDTCGIKTVGVPWARPDSGFTLLFEALVMTMISAMPVKAVARIVGEHDTRLWRMVHHYVDAARARADASGVTRLAIDETAARRGQDYITLFVDIDQARVLFATEGKDAETVAAFADDLTAHRGDPETINDAVEKVRRAEQKSQSLLRGTRYIWLRNPANLSARQRATLEGLPTRHLKTARAYQIRLAFQDLYDQPSVQDGAVFLNKWYFWATHSKLDPIIDAARTVKRHWNGILRWFDSKDRKSTRLN